MRKIYRLIVAIAVLAVASSCLKDYPQDSLVPEGDGILLKLDTGSMDLKTKADSTRPGDDDGSFNENILGDAVDIFFFPEGATGTSTSTKSVRASVLGGGFVLLPVSTADLHTIFGSTVAGSEAEIFVLANYNGATTIDHSQQYSLDDLREISLAKADWSVFPQSNFVMISDNQDTENPSPLVTLTLTNPTGNTPASGTVKMKRIAAKISFRLTVADEIAVENITRDHEGNIVEKTIDRWHPLKEAMTVYLQYSMNYARVGGMSQAVPALPKGAGAADSLYTYKENKLAETTETVLRTRTIIDGAPYKDPDNPGEWIVPSHVEHDVQVPVYITKHMQHTSEGGVDVGTLTGHNGPFYTYPVTWDPGVQTEPFLKLIIPWNNGSRTKYYYYKVPFSGTSIEANNWYEITLDVQILGGEDELPVPLEATYKVVEWVEGEETEASTVAARYLSVPRTEWIMYNTDSLTIPITSSHDVQIVGYQVKGGGTAVGNAFASADKYTNGQPRPGSWIGSDPSIYNPFTDTRYTINNTTTVGTIYATKPNFNDNNLGTPTPTNVNATSWFSATEVTRDQIVLRHNLNNDLTTNNYDVAPYWIRIRVQHKDDTNYYRDIIIEQRPAIYIEPNQNSDNGSATNVGSNYGYVYINNAQGTSNNWQRVRGLAGSNKNVNMYVINVSVLEASSTYVLGDPREEQINNLTTGNTFNSAPALYGTTPRRLTYYYPTKTDDVTKNMIAPTLRVASSYGVCEGAINRTDAQYRCAAYQEDGVPAGRWRVPTRAEVEFITKLSAQGVIPTLFNVGGSSYYWSASGAIQVTANGTVNDVNQTSAYVRCVYDEWFWMDTTNQKVTNTQFTWGDQPKESVVRTKALY